MKARIGWLMAAAAAGGLAVTPAAGRENRVLKCRPSVARSALGAGGPALVANVPRSMTPIDLNAVQMTDKRLRRAMLVEALFAQRTAADTLRVTARFVNCTGSPLVVQARSSFMTANQVPTEAASVWKTVFLPPYATGVYDETSIGGSDVAAYLIELRKDN